MKKKKKKKKINRQQLNDSSVILKSVLDEKSLLDMTGLNPIEEDPKESMHID